MTPATAGRDTCVVMYSRVVDEARIELRELREDEWNRLGLGAAAIALALVATHARPALALPLFLGGIALAAAGLRSAWLHWDLLERLAGERDAYVIPEVLARASREATMERRTTYAALIRGHLLHEALSNAGPPELAVRAELEKLVAELLDERLDLDPASAVLCFRMLSDLGESSLVGACSSPEAVRSRTRQIRAGFAPRRLDERDASNTVMAG